MEAKVDPRRCTVDLSHFGEDNGSGNSSFSFITRDKNGDIVSTNTLFGVKIMNQQDGVESEVIIKRTREEGLYEVIFAPLNNGVYLVVLGILSPNGTIVQDMVKGSPFTVRVGPDPAQDRRVIPEPSKCYVFGPGSRQTAVKRKTSFVLQACGVDGTKARHGGDGFKVKVVPPSGGKLSSLPSSIMDQKDGTYTISFTPAVPGEHIVHITTAEDVYVANSPFSIPVFETMEPVEEVDPAKVVIDFDRTTSLPNTIFGFLISAKNVKGHSMNASLQFRARITSPEGLDVQNKVVECENGNFLLKFVPKQQGRHDFDVDVCVNGLDQYAPVRGSPATLDLSLSYGDEGKIKEVRVLSKVPREKTPENSFDRVSPRLASNSPIPVDGNAPKIALSRDAFVPKWVPTSSSTSVKPPPLSRGTDPNVLKRRFSSPPAVSLFKSYSPSPSSSSPLSHNSSHSYSPHPPLSHISSSTSSSFTPTSSFSPPLGPSKPSVPPKNPSTPLSAAASPPAWLKKSATQKEK